MTRYCNSSMAHGVCRFSGKVEEDGVPVCDATASMHYACEYRWKGFGRPIAVEPIVLSSKAAKDQDALRAARDVVSDVMIPLSPDGRLDNANSSLTKDSKS